MTFKYLIPRMFNTIGLDGFIYPQVTNSVKLIRKNVLIAINLYLFGKYCRKIRYFETRHLFKSCINQKQF